MKKYIHYGSTNFDRRVFVVPTNVFAFTKPSGGLWASPVDAEFGWKDWCEREDFEWCDFKKSFTFALSEHARVLNISSVEVLGELPQCDTYLDWTLLDFEKLLADGWDAAEVSISADPRLYWTLYGWDCDSIVVLNPDVIVEE